MAITLDGIYVNGQKALFRPEDIVDGDVSAYAQEVGAAVEEWLEENVTGGEQVTDTTLTLPGVPADAEVTGNKIYELNEDLNVNLYSEMQADSDGFQQGWYGQSAGNLDKQTTAICIIRHLDNINLNGTLHAVKCDPDYKMRIQAWNTTGTYIGIWNGTTLAKSNSLYATEFDIDFFYATYPNYHFKVTLFAVDGSDVTIQDASHICFVYSYQKQNAVTVESLSNLKDYTWLFTGTWEKGSIYQDGKAYDSSTWAIRTNYWQKQYLPQGVIVTIDNDLIGRLYGFQYSVYGEYIGRVGDGTKTLTIPADGLYRFVLIRPNHTTIADEDIPLFSAGFSIYAEQLSNILESAKSKNYTYRVSGAKIDLSAQGYNVAGAGFSLPPTSISEGLTARQDFDIYNGVLFQLFSNNYVALVDVTDGTVITSYQITSGHGNACQFSAEFYDANDTYPLLYCFGYSDNIVYVNRVTDEGATLIRKYKLSTAGYRFSGGIDVANNELVTIHFKKDSSTSASNNGNYITVWDLNSVTTDETDDTLVPEIVSQVEIPFLPVVQGCAFFKGVLYVVSGYYNPYGYPVKVVGYDKMGKIVTELTEFSTTILHNEGEGISFPKHENTYQCWFATYNLYRITFE